MVRQVPRGRVASYGQIARIVGGCTPRMVGFAMAACRRGVPWQRVLNSQGKISLRSEGDGAARQKRALEREGVRFSDSGRVSFREYGWLPFD